jgi:hypothetical protein
MGAMLGIMMSPERKKAANPKCGVRSINTAKAVQPFDIAIFPPNALCRPIQQECCKILHKKQLRDPLVPPASN